MCWSDISDEHLGIDLTLHYDIFGFYIEYLDVPMVFPEEQKFILVERLYAFDLWPGINLILNLESLCIDDTQVGIIGLCKRSTSYIEEIADKI